MKEFQKDEYIFFAETAFYDPSKEGDKEEATQYLLLWEKMLLRRLTEELANYTPVEPDEYGKCWIERGVEYFGLLGVYAALSYRIAFIKKLPSQI